MAPRRLRAAFMWLLVVWSLLFLEAGPGRAFSCADADNDGVCDSQDNCPQTPNPNQTFAVKLNAPPGPSGSVTKFALSPDGSRVVFLADKLYSVPIAGGTAVLLGSATFWFEVSAVGGMVVYAKVGALNQLFSVPIAGGTSVVLDTSAFGSFVNFRISADGARVIYWKKNSSAQNELFSVPIGGGTPVKLNASGDVEKFQLAPNSARVVYLQGGGSAATNGLYSVPIAGGAAVQLSAVPVDYYYYVTPDSQTVIYFNGALQKVPIAGGTSTILDPSAHTDPEKVLPTPDSTHVLYVKGNGGFATQLFIVGLSGGAPLALSGPIPDDGRVKTLLVSPDGGRAVYAAGSNFSTKLYSVPTGGGPRVELGHMPPVGGVEQDDYAITPDSSRVIYRADQGVNNQIEAYGVAIAGGTPLKLNGPLVPGGGVSAMKLDPTGARVIYVADQKLDGVLELFAVPLGGGPSVQLSGSMVQGGDVDQLHFTLTADGLSVVYLADQEINNQYELYRVSTDADDAGIDPDNDGSGNACDCSDANPHCSTDCTDADHDEYCAPADCNDAASACTTVCVDVDDDAVPVCAGDCNDGAYWVYPGAPELCNAKDDDCDNLIDEDDPSADTDGDQIVTCDNCPAVANAAQENADGDPAGDACDNCPFTFNLSQSDIDSDQQGDRCDGDDGLIYVVARAGAEVDWDDEAGYDVWNLYRGDLAVLRATGNYTQAPGPPNPAAWQWCGLPDSFVVDPQAPAGPGTVWIYAATGVSGGVEGDLGTDSHGAPRPNDNPCP
jgi:hypothetical protein